MLKRLTALVLGLLLLFGTAHASLTDATTAAWMDENSDVRFSLSAQVETLLPYGEEALNAFNAALKHVSVSAAVVGEETSVDLCVAGDRVVGLTEKPADTGTQLTTPLLPNRILTSRASAMDALAGAETAQPAFDLFAAIEELEGCYAQLTDAILPYAEEKKANYNIKGVGSSKWSRIARLTVEQSAELAPLIAQVLGCGMDEAFRAELAQATYGKSFIVGLYQTKEGGDDLAVYIKGNLFFADGVRRALSYQWAFSTDEDGTRVDSFKFEMNRAKAPRDDREINARYERRASGGRFVMDGECEARIMTPEAATVATTTTHDLKGSETGDVRTLVGTVETQVKTTLDGDTETLTTTITPDLTLTASMGSGVLSGAAGYERRLGKDDVQLSATLTFDEKPAELFADAVESGTLFVVTDDDQAPRSSLSQNWDEEEEPEDFLVGKPPVGYVSHTAPEQETVIDLDAIADGDYAALMDELSQNLAGKLLIAMAKLPQEDMILLSDMLSEADYAAFLALVEGL